MRRAKEIFWNLEGEIPSTPPGAGSIGSIRTRRITNSENLEEIELKPFARIVKGDLEGSMVILENPFGSLGIRERNQWGMAV